MAQSVGYLLAAVGPVAFGLLHSLSSGWRAPLLLMVVVAAAQAVAALVAGRGTVAPASRPRPDLAAPAPERSAPAGRRSPRGVRG
jgi:CP family cyanate transporter-like MFS transporter